MSSTPLLRAALATVLLAGALAACSSEIEPAHEHPAPSEPADHEHAPDFHGGKPRTPEISAVWDDTVEQAAAEAAIATMTAYVGRGSVNRDEWWQNLAPHLDAIATRDYAWLDPANIPANQVTGPAVITRGETPTLAYAEVPTDVGAFSLTLSRKDGASPWEAGRIEPPQGLH